MQELTSDSMSSLCFVCFSSETLRCGGSTNSKHIQRPLLNGLLLTILTILNREFMSLGRGLLEWCDGFRQRCFWHDERDSTSSAEPGLRGVSIECTFDSRLALADFSVTLEPTSSMLVTSSKSSVLSPASLVLTIRVI